MNLDNTFKAASKATVVDDSKARTKLMKGGILSILNESNDIITWVTEIISISHRMSAHDNLERFCQSGSATEMIELIEAFKVRVELLGVPLPEMVTVDNCCTVGNKLREVIPNIKVLLDVYHFITRYIY